MMATDRTLETSCRRLGDRRVRPTTLLDALRFRGRRRGFRRSDEGIRTYVDRPAREVVVLAFFLMAASGLDAQLTLWQLESGAIEANPLMDLALRRGIGFFVGVKMAITAWGAAFLSIHQLYPLGIRALRFLACAYALLLVYHTALLYAYR